MTSAGNLKLGRWGEKVAAAYLSSQGYTILGNNLRTPYGEIDLLVRQADSLVFVEVKTRSSSSLGLPEISITPRKFAHMTAAAQSYLLDHPELDQPWRIDVISIQCRPSGQPPDITHFENVNDVC
jgi:putative endonuclease